MRTKKIVLPGLVLLFLSSFVFSCRKENLNGTSSLADSTALFSATIDGVAWSTDTVSAYLAYEYASKARIMTITGYSSKRLITISLRDTALSAAGSNDSTMALQSYTVGSWGNASAFGYGYNKVIIGPSVTWQQEGSAQSGQATVTTSDGTDKRISGNFNFVAKCLLIDSAGLKSDTVNVTNGVFKNIPYSYFRRP